MVVFGQIGFAQAKVVVFGQKWLYSRKRGCSRAIVVVFGKRLFYLDKVVVFGQNLFYSAKLFYSSKSCCIRTNCL